MQIPKNSADAESIATKEFLAQELAAEWTEAHLSEFHFSRLDLPDQPKPPRPVCEPNTTYPDNSSSPYH